MTSYEAGNQLEINDVVYFVQNLNEKSTDKPVVLKASVNSRVLQGSGKRTYPFVSLWSGIVAPYTDEILVARAPRQLFTEPEVTKLLAEHLKISIDELEPVDDWLDNDLANRELASVLGAATLQRLAEDEARAKK